MTEQTNEPNIYKVPVHNMKWFETKFRALIKKANKCGAEAPSFVNNGTETVTYNKGKRNEKTVVYNLIEVFGMRPAIAGWEFVARIEHTGSGNMIKARPNFEGEDFSSYYEGGTVCEHCKVNRYRKHTYIVQNEETGNRMQVGNSCLTDFLGHASPEYYARLAEFEGDVYELFLSGGAHPPRPEDYLPLQEVLETALNVIKIDEGYRTARVHGGKATSSQTSWFYFGSDMGDKEKTWSRFKEKVNEMREESDLEKIKTVIEHHKTAEAKGDFQHNLKVIANEGIVTGKDFGIACYMIQNYFNFEKKKAEWQLKAEQRAKELASKKNEWIGEVREKKKDRRDFEVTYISTASFDNQFGTTYFHRFEDAEGRLIVAKVSKGVNYMVQELVGFNSQERRVEEGDKFIFKASITKHDEYKERKQTYVNRIKMIGYEALQSA